MKDKNNSPPRNCRTFTLLALILIPYTVLVLYPESRLHAINVIRRGGGSGRLSSFFQPVLSPAEPELRLLLGVITRPGSHVRRHIVRHAYALQQSSLDYAGARVDVRFVFCNLTRRDHRAFLAMEIKLYNDIIILNCTENMNNGKTYAYFSSLPKLFAGGDRPYDFVLKADDDALFMLDNLVEIARRLPREDVYAGSYVPCANYTAETFRYFAGYGYMLSWDLVEWIAASEIPRSRSVGLEDKMVGEWLREGKRGKNKFDMNPNMYDYMYDKGNVECFRHEFVPETVAVHQLKSEWNWVAAIEYFNLTDGLKPSNLYTVAYPTES